MSLIEISTPASALEAGTYEMELGNVERKTFDQFVGDGLYGPDNGQRFVWLWVDPEDDSTYVEQLTTTATGPKSRTNEVLVALLGAENVGPGKKYDEADLIGKHALVSIGLNEKGYAKVEKVTALPVKRKARMVAVPQEVEDEPSPF